VGERVGEKRLFWPESRGGQGAAQGCRGKLPLATGCAAEGDYAAPPHGIRQPRLNQHFRHRGEQSIHFIRITLTSCTYSETSMKYYNFCINLHKCDTKMRKSKTPKHYVVILFTYLIMPKKYFDASSQCLGYILQRSSRFFNEN